MSPERRIGPSYMRGGVVAVRRGGTHLRGVAPVTDGVAAGTWRGETDASVPHFICKQNFPMRMKIIYTKNIFEDS